MHVPLCYIITDNITYILKKSIIYYVFNDCHRFLGVSVVLN